MAILYVFIKLHAILFNEVLNNKVPKTNPAVPSSLLAPESRCHCHWISPPLQRASHLHRLVNGDVYGSRILIATPTSLSHVRATRWQSRIFSVFARTCARGISHERHGYTDVVFAPTTYCDSLLAPPTLLLVEMQSIVGRALAMRGWRFEGA